MTKPSSTTGLLPAWLGFTGTTRQNDLDVSFTISLQPNMSGKITGMVLMVVTKAHSLSSSVLNFGDASWGSC